MEEEEIFHIHSMRPLFDDTKVRLDIRLSQTKKIITRKLDRPKILMNIDAKFLKLILAT